MKLLCPDDELTTTLDVLYCREMPEINLLVNQLLGVHPITKLDKVVRYT